MRNLFFSLGGFSADYISACSKGAQKSILLLVYLLFISSAFSAFMLSQTVSSIIKPDVPFFLLFISAWAIIFVLERTILTADLGANFLIWVRVSMAVVVAFITSLSVELEFFGTTAVNQQKQSLSDSIAVLKTDFKKDKTKLSNQRAILLSAFNTSLDSISAKRKSYDNEIIAGNGQRLRGPGPVSAKLYEAFVQDSALLERKNVEIIKQILLLENNFIGDSLSYENEVSKLGGISLDDPIKKMQAIHHVVFKSYSTIFFYVIIHLFFILFELIVLIGKFSNNSAFAEYHGLRDKELKQLEKKNQIDNRLKESSLITELHNNQIDNELMQIQTKSKAKLKAATEQLTFLNEYSNIIHEAEEIINTKIADEDKEDVKKYYRTSSIDDLKASTDLFKIKL